MENRKNHSVNILIFLSFTLLGLYRKEVTVFYIIYLFWFEELVKTLIDLGFIIKREKKIIIPLANTFPVFFVMFIYWIFIVVFFGVWAANPLELNSKDFINNIKILLFRNIFFDFNIMAFAVHYILYLLDKNDIPEKLLPFNRRHIILHISIILGGILITISHLKLNIPTTILPILLITPFLILKILFDKTFDDNITIA